MERGIKNKKYKTYTERVLASQRSLFAIRRMFVFFIILNLPICMKSGYSLIVQSMKNQKAYCLFLSYAQLKLHQIVQLKITLGMR